MSLEVTISVPSAPVPPADQQYRRKQGQIVTPDTCPILNAEAHDSIDGYGIAGGDMS